LALGALLGSDQIVSVGSRLGLWSLARCLTVGSKQSPLLASPLECNWAQAFAETGLG